MPTGYTSDLYDGKPQTFEQFTLQCARAFGATIMQRDDPFDAPLRLPKPSTHNDERMTEAQNDLDKFRAMPLGVAEVEAEESYQRSLAEWKKSEALGRERQGRYRSMLADVAGWNLPSKDHVGLKEFMVKQLKESIDFDCEIWEPPVRVSGEEYRKRQIAVAATDLEYHTKAMAEEIERTNGRRTWITDLAASLGVEWIDDMAVPA